MNVSIVQLVMNVSIVHVVMNASITFQQNISCLDLGKHFFSNDDLQKCGTYFGDSDYYDFFFLVKFITNTSESILIFEPNDCQSRHPLT